MAALASGERQDGTRADVRQALTALTAIRARAGGDPYYEPDNLLLQHVQDLRRSERAPRILWEALDLHTVNLQDRVRLARRAVERGLYRLAASLLEPAASAGDDTTAMRMLESLLRAAGHTEEADTWKHRLQPLQDFEREVPLCSAATEKIYEGFGKILLQISVRWWPDKDTWQRWTAEFRRWSNSEQPTDGTGYDLPPEVLARCRPELLAEGKPKQWDEHDDTAFVAVSIALYYAQAARVGDLVATMDVRDTILTIYDPGHPRVRGHTWPDGINRGSGRSNLKADERHWGARPRLAILTPCGYSRG